MELTKQQKKEFSEAARPLMEYLDKNHHPHMKVIVGSLNAEIMEGCAIALKDDFEITWEFVEWVEKSTGECFVNGVDELGNEYEGDGIMMCDEIVEVSNIINKNDE